MVIIVLRSLLHCHIPLQLLAVVFDTFNDVEKTKFKSLLLHKRSAIDHAFQLLVSRQVRALLLLQIVYFYDAFQVNCAAVICSPEANRRVSKTVWWSDAFLQTTHVRERPLPHIQSSEHVRRSDAQVTVWWFCFFTILLLKAYLHSLQMIKVLVCFSLQDFYKFYEVTGLKWKVISL